MDLFHTVPITKTIAHEVIDATEIFAVCPRDQPGTINALAFTQEGGELIVQALHRRIAEEMIR